MLVKRPPRVGVFSLGVVERLLRADQLGIFIGLQVVEQVLVVGLAFGKRQLSFFDGVVNRQLLNSDRSLQIGGVELAENIAGDHLIAHLDVNGGDQPGLGRINAGSGVAFHRAVERDAVFKAAP